LNPRSACEYLAENYFLLGEDVRLSIEIPKFGEDLPLTLDFSGTNPALLRESALEVSAAVKESLEWSCQLHEWETGNE